MLRHTLAVLVLVLFSQAAFAQGGKPAAPGPPTPAEATVTVMCPGDSVQAALETRAEVLTIQVRGICRETFVVRRDHVFFRGTNAAIDGFEGTGSSVEGAQGMVRVFGGSNVEFRDLSFSNSRRAGLFVGGGGTVRVANGAFRENPSDGIQAAYGTVTVTDTTFSTTAGRYAISAWTSDGVFCTRCTITGGHQMGALAVGARVVLNDSEVEGANLAVGGWEVSEVHVNGSTLRGGIGATMGTTFIMGNTEQTSVGAWGNFVSRDSYLELNSGASLGAGLQAYAFSKILLVDDENTSPGSIGGAVQCYSRAEMFCVDPAAIAGPISDCGSCSNDVEGAAALSGVSESRAPHLELVRPEELAVGIAGPFER